MTWLSEAQKNTCFGFREHHILVTTNMTGDAWLPVKKYLFIIASNKARNYPELSLKIPTDITLTNVETLWSLVKNILWFHTYKCLNADSNCSHHLDRIATSSSAAICATSWYESRVINTFKQICCLQKGELPTWQPGDWAGKKSRPWSRRLSRSYPYNPVMVNKFTEKHITSEYNPGLSSQHYWENYFVLHKCLGDRIGWQHRLFLFMDMPIKTYLWESNNTALVKSKLPNLVIYYFASQQMKLFRSMFSPSFQSLPLRTVSLNNQQSQNKMMQ